MLFRSQPLPSGRALLSINFEYISAQTWSAGFSEAVGTTLPLEPLQQSLASRGGSVDVASLAANDPLRPLIEAVARAAMADLGIGVLELEQGSSGWRRLGGSRYERRIDGLSGLSQPEHALRCSGPRRRCFATASRLATATALANESSAPLPTAPAAPPPGAPC